jgi:phosphoglycolate phosphatase
MPTGSPPDAPRACVLFDLDGTLIDSRADIADALDAALLRFDLPPVGELRVRAMVGDGARMLVARALALHAAGEERIDAVLAAFLEEYRRTHLAKTKLYPGVADALAELLRLGAVCGVISNKPYEFTVSLLEHLGVAAHMAVVLGGDSMPERKPDPAPVRAALVACGAEASRAAMVGDGETDVRAALAAGVLAVGVTYGFRTAEELEAAGADLLVARAGDLVPTLAAALGLGGEGVGPAPEAPGHVLS